MSATDLNHPKVDKVVDRAARRRWAVLVAAVFMLGLAMVLMFMLTTATDNRALYEAKRGGRNRTVAEGGDLSAATAAAS